MHFLSICIAFSDVTWSTSSEQGFRLQYRDIAVHAVSTDRQVYVYFW